VRWLRCAAIQALAVNPRPRGCRKLAGSKNDWHIRSATAGWFTKSRTWLSKCASTACATVAEFIPHPSHAPLNSQSPTLDHFGAL
jgi:hypothetical protein